MTDLNKELAHKQISKKCNVCKEDKSLSDFYFRNDAGKYKNRCKRCCIDGKNMDRSKTAKKCKHCGEEKPFSEYQKAGGGKWLQPYCKQCDSVRKKEYVRNNNEAVKKSKQRYYLDNREQLSIKSKGKRLQNPEINRNRAKSWRDKNKERDRLASIEYRRKNKEIIYNKRKEKRLQNPEFRGAQLKRFKESRTPEQKEKSRIQQKEWRAKNKDKIKAQRQLPEAKQRRRETNRIRSREKAATDISFRVIKNIRSRIGFALKRDIKKSATTRELLGCSVDFLKEYFTSLFTVGMTWDAFMNGDIHIDHIKPCKLFDLTKPEEQRKCFHYTNLQPLWWYDNLKKGDNYQEQKPD